jgi:hypothetical protein
MLLFSHANFLMRSALWKARSLRPPTLDPRLLFGSPNSCDVRDVTRWGFLPHWLELYTKKVAQYFATDTLVRECRSPMISKTSCGDIVIKGTKISATGSGDRTVKAKIAHS